MVVVGPFHCHHFAVPWMILVTKKWHTNGSQGIEKKYNSFPNFHCESNLTIHSRIKHGMR